MQNIQKRKTEYLKNFIFKRIENTVSITALYCCIVAMNIVFDGIVLLQYIFGANLYKQFAVQFLFYLQVGILVLGALIAVLGQLNNTLKQTFSYYVLAMESVSIIFIRNLYLCLSPQPPAFHNQLTIRICQLIIFIIFTLTILIIKNNMYYPFQYCVHLFSMRQQNISMWLFILRVIVGGVFWAFPNHPDRFKVLVFATVLFFWKSRSPGYLHLWSRRAWDIYYYFISWSLFALFLSYYIPLINDTAYMSLLHIPSLSYSQTVLFLWTYTFPFVILLPIYKSNIISSNYWQNLFLVYDHELDKQYEKEDIYLLCDQLRQFVEDVKKSQFKYKDVGFKKLTVFINKHVGGCQVSGCPLQELVELRQSAPTPTQDNMLNQSAVMQRDYHQHRTYLKTLKCTLQFLRLTLLKIRQNYPNTLQLQLQISHFYLIGLKNKQQGMILYNQFNTNKTKKNEPTPKQYNTQQQQQNGSNGQIKNNKDNINNVEQTTNKGAYQVNWSQQYATYYLKKKIDNIFNGEQKQISTNMNIDNQLSEFRQKIQVSVTMLVEFWSLLSDPKCNLKKMYDLANILFPLKTNIEENWQKIKKYKNIQIYNIYAKYLIKMFNDKENGIKIYQQAKKIDNQMRNKQEMVLDQKGDSIVQENGIIFMEFDGKNSGVMFQVNINAQKIFGYNKGQLLNRKVNDLMPLIYSTQHDKILENYQQTNQSSMMNKQRYVWGKTKNGYLFPFVILIKPILSFYSQSSNSQVYANIKKQIYLKEIIGIVVDTENNVCQFSSSALRVFPVLGEDEEQGTGKYNGHGKRTSAQDKSTIKITQLIPNFSQLKQKILLQNEQCQLKIQRTIKSTRNPNTNSNKPNNKQAYIEKCTYNIQCSEVNIKICGKIGYIVKLVKMGNSQFLVSGAEGREGKEEKEGLGSGVGEKKGSGKVKFQVPEEDEDNGASKSFIFSYDMTEKIKNFSASAKKVQAIKLSKPIVPLPKSQKKQQKFTHPPEPQHHKPIVTSTSSQSAAQPNYNLAYVGGFTKSLQILSRIKTQTVSTFKAQLKVTEQQYQENRMDYAVGIKTKRLQDNAVREMREEQSDLEYKKNAQVQEEKQEASHHHFTQIKPSQLSLISSSSAKNSQIRNMRILTVFLLLTCSVVCIIQHILQVKNNQQYYLQLRKVKFLSQIRTQILNINFLVNYLCKFQGKQFMSYPELENSIDQLDQYSKNFVFTTDTQLKYRDGSSDKYYLGFAINKLISQSNSLKLDSVTKLIPISDPSTYFIRYNTINGLSISLEKQQETLETNMVEIQNKLQKLTLIFLSTCISLIFVVLLIKNILLRCVMSRKTEILQIFFQIPRASCSRIQKQCEVFILQLSASNQQEQMEFISSNQGEQFEGANGKGGGKVHKKRVAVGQQNSSCQFGLVSFAFLVFLVSFQLFTIVKNSYQWPSTQTLQHCNTLLYTLQHKLCQLSILTVTHALSQQSYKSDKQIPFFQQYNHLQVISRLKQQFIEMIKQSRKSFYDLQKIYNDGVDAEMSRLYYESVCEGQCGEGQGQDAGEENNGLNSLVSKYIEILKQHISQIRSNQYTLDMPHYLQIKQYQHSMKQHWRQLTNLIQQSTQKYIIDNQTLNLFVLVGICVVNMVGVLAAWMWYYWRLEDKIIATQYILGFIPIDQVNRNGKIAEYIRKQILSRKV